MNRIHFLALLIGIFCLYFTCPPAMAQSRDELFITPMVKDNKYAQLMVVTTLGDTLKYKKADSQVLDFRKHIVNGKTFYSYFLKDGALNGKDQKYHVGYRIITDTGFNEIQRITLKSHGIANAGKYPAVEHHDFVYLDEGHYIIAAYYEHHPTNIPSEFHPSQNIIVVAPLVQEVKKGKVVWQWLATDYPELYYSSREYKGFSNDTLPADYLHINSMAIDPKDGNLLVSFRDANQLVKLNRKKDGIVWKLGGKGSDFNLPDSAVFLRQHHATMINNGRTILMIDNGEKGVREYTRVVELDIDEPARKVIAHRLYNIPGKFIEFGGSVQKFGGNYFIGGGSAGYILEVNPLTGVISYEVKLELGSYRVYKYLR